MDLTQLPVELWVQGVFCVLFVWLLRIQMAESKERENKLMAQIERQNETQDKIVCSLERLEKDINEIKNNERE
ncbi:BhlA/UviB family holin-like peptide [Domibacillus mangrovi]|uniref:Holin n=1 Tax=Domibacillus mangrovi TaxID=1714354 RepID=A0A1Q5P4A0_9BACI|nr:BhlA/UviB family holin-like peptide [Domibacillus mangrovi]OKL36922.1 holin [Domibacillus mangrovi]